MLRTERGIHIAEVTMNYPAYFCGERARQVICMRLSMRRWTALSVSSTSTRRRSVAECPGQNSVKWQRIQTTADDAPEPRIVRTKRFALRPMDVEEAVMQMELLGHDFFVFRDADSGDVSVVYKRRDGNYGLIESEF